MRCDITTRVDAKAYSITLFNYKSKESTPALREGCEREIRLSQQNDLFRFILTLTALDNLFNLLLFLVGILFTMSVATHHHISPIDGLPSPAVIGQPRPSSGTPGRPQASPAVTCGPPHHLSSCARPSFLIPAVCIPPRSPCLHPIVLACTIPCFDTPYSPP